MLRNHLGAIAPSLVLLSTALACGGPASTPSQSAPPVAVGDEPTVPSEPSAMQQLLAAQTPADWASDAREATRIQARIDAYAAAHPTRRAYIALDRPLVRPGETVWFRLFDLGTRDLAIAPTGQATFRLVSPKGARVLEKRVRVQKGNAANDFEIPAGVPGGEYTITATTGRGVVATRPFIVSSYQPPRIKKQLKFLRKAYGTGDRVAAALKLSRATGEPLRTRSATAVVTLDGAEIARQPVATDIEGRGVVRFELPDVIAKGNGLLTVLVEDGGVTESIQRRVPIALKSLSFANYPEGGQLVSGLPGRVYFAAKNPLGKPADVEGRVIDSDGHVVAAFRSVHDGMGRFEITPKAGQTYRVTITKPAGIAGSFALPPALETGCSMVAVDDVRSERDHIRVGLWCSRPQVVSVTASLRERTLATASVSVGSSEPTVVALPVATDAGSGAVRVTVFSSASLPLAERLVFRDRQGAAPVVSITADRESYNPRDRVKLAIEARDAAGQPVAADLALTVVDDTVLSFADDKTAALKARVLLESAMPGQRIHEPNFYFSSEPLAAVGRDLVMGTHGWRRFDWQLVFAPPRPKSGVWRALSNALGQEKADPNTAEERPVARRKRGKARDEAKPKPVAIAAAEPEPKAEPEPVEEDEAEKAERVAFDPVGGGPGSGIALDGLVDKEWAGKGGGKRAWWAPIRTFPVPNYDPDDRGPRTDFRETIYWQPQVVTDARGMATVEFTTSDSITSFRAIAEGIGGGALVRGESLVTSKLPVSLAVKMPVEVSRGDHVRLPVTVSNETRRTLHATLQATVGAAFVSTTSLSPTRLELGPGERRSLFYELDVVGSGADAAEGAVRVVATAANLRDEVERTIKVSPRGFPQEISLAGTVATVSSHELALPQMHAGSLRAELVMYPSPLATMIEGTEAIIREPTGCFEQASSANYPNVMVLEHLSSAGTVDPALLDRTQQMLDRGYKKLTGYESSKRGYEWFGGDPGHEALTAYGLMEFVDMQAVYDDVDTQMIKRTAAWLKSRRDGKGGFQRNSRALDSFGRASEAVTNAYITYALATAGQTGIDAELAASAAVAEKTGDPYVLALSAGALLASPTRAASGRVATARLVGMQKKDGSFAGADHSITRSGGVALTIETTALAALAMMGAGREHDADVRRAIAWLNENRNGFGGYGSTQSTVLALKAMTRYATHSRQTKAAGTAMVLVNGEQVGRIAYDKGHRDALRFDLSAHLSSGRNQLEVKLDSSVALPYSVAVTYASDVPSSSAGGAVAVETALTRTSVPMGEGVRMKVRVSNREKKGIPMAIARIGIPGGLTAQTWQLKELREAKVIDFYETRDREVVLYFRSMAPSRVASVDLELLAAVPGSFVAPASRAYLYYTDEHKVWASPVQVTVK